MKRTFTIQGMMCAACASHVEHATASVQGVHSVAVSLLTNSMQVELDEGCEEAVLHAVKSAGYTAQLMQDGQLALPTQERTAPLWPLIMSLCLSALVMYIDMGHMWLPYPAWLRADTHPTLYLLLQCLLSIPIVLLNYRYFVGGVRSMLSRAPNMDSLIALGSGTALIYSTVLLGICLFGSPSPALAARAAFSSGGMILSLVTLGKTLEGRAKDKTADAIRALSALTPDTVTVLADGKEQQKPTAELTLDDRLIVKTGDRIPCDGVVQSGHLSVDESALTGESLPVDKDVEAIVSCGCTVVDGVACVRPCAIGEQTSLSKTVRMVSEASATKAPIAKLADRVSAYFVPAVLIIALVTFGLWLAIGHDLAQALTYAINVLVISCPCALGLATPTAIMCAMGRGAQLGVLIKHAGALEGLGRIRHVAFDKTGTLTTGRMQVCDHVLCDDITQSLLFSVAYTVESQSHHPVARAVSAFTEGAPSLPQARISTMNGKGMFAKCEDEAYAVGNAALMKDCDIEIDALADFQAAADARGASVVYVASSEQLLGAFAVADTPKEDCREAIAALQSLDVACYMLTGDTPAAASHIAQEVGLSHVYASLSPEGKGTQIQALSAEAPIAMVGDGINDCLPLVAADVGIAMGAGTDVAIESCDVVVRSGHISDVVRLLRLGRYTLRKIRQNLFWALIYNAICIPIASGALAFLGLSITPMIASAAMALSSLTVVGNALTIKRFR